MIFLDTGFVLALVSKRDENHQRVKDVLDAYRGRSLWDEVLTTNHVVTETITAVRFKAEPNNPDRSHEIAVGVGRGFYHGDFGRIYQVTPEEERDAFEYFCKYRDKEYSCVDCVSFAIMEKLVIREALSVDEDFTHRFVARPGPRPK